MVTQTAGVGQAPATLTVAEAAERLHLPEKTVLRAIHTGKLRGFQPGLSRWRVLASSVEAWLRGAEDGVPAGVPDKLRRFSRLTAELTALGLELADDLQGVSK
jgi:excisionase family DNA binding protein